MTITITDNNTICILQSGAYLETTQRRTAWREAYRGDEATTAHVAWLKYQLDEAEVVSEGLEYQYHKNCLATFKGYSDWKICPKDKAQVAVYKAQATKAKVCADIAVERCASSRENWLTANRK
tara:strand:- start:175 stop:543 length:369 start_codon:yes stop_codon:yes gene_type:complete